MQGGQKPSFSDTSKENAEYIVFVMKDPHPDKTIFSK
jgi:hypothetical protein